MKRRITRLQHDILQLTALTNQMAITGNYVQIDGAMVDDLEAVEINLQELESYATRAKVLVLSIESETTTILKLIP